MARDMSEFLWDIDFIHSDQCGLIYSPIAFADDDDIRLDWAAQGPTEESDWDY